MQKGGKSVYSYYFLIPAALIYILFFIIPTLMSFYFSLTNWDLNKADFVGLDNFRQILIEPSLNIGIRNTFIFALVSIILKVIVGLGLALLLNMGLKSQNYLRTIFFFPVILSTVAAGLIFTSLYHPTTGLVNRFLTTIGAGFLAQDWFGNPKLAIYSVVSVDVWRWMGFLMVIFLAGLQSVPREYYEATYLDGGSSFQSFRHVTLPLIRPATTSCVILSMISGLRIFDAIYVTTKGGPGYASDVLASIVYKEFADGYYGLATAGGVLLFIIVSVIVFPAYIYFSNKEVEL